MIIANRIKEIIIEFIKNEYFSYMKNNNLLLIESDILKDKITEIYNNNTKILIKKIKDDLKNEMGSEYPAFVVDNTLYDIFDDSTLNINRIMIEIENYQESIIKEIELNVYNKNLGIKISIDNFVNIVSAENPNKEDNLQDDIYNTINNYKYIYSINNQILSKLDTESKITCIKNCVNNYNKIKIILVK